VRSLLVCATCLVGACLSERPRPAPPQIGIVFAKPAVQSPDTLRGSVQAQDPDGVDSVWLTVGSGPTLGDDGLFETEFSAPFQVLIPRGYAPGERIPVTIRARDVVGFTDELDTLIRVSQ